MADNTITLSLWDVAKYLDLHGLELVRVQVINGQHHGYARQKKAANKAATSTAMGRARLNISKG